MKNRKLWGNVLVFLSGGIAFLCVFASLVREVGFITASFSLAVGLLILSSFVGGMLLLED